MKIQRETMLIHTVWQSGLFYTSRLINDFRQDPDFSKISIRSSPFSYHIIIHYFDRYGVSHSHVGFVLDATYTFILALVQLMCLCYYKRSGMPAGVEPLPRISRYSSSRIPNEMMRRRQEYSSGSSLSLTSLDSWYLYLYYHVSKITDNFLLKS